MTGKNYLAMDFGASTGRGIVGNFDGKRLTLREVHRFQNYFVPVAGNYYWDAFRLFHEILLAVTKAGHAEGTAGLYSIGIDTWGTDYGLLDENGQLLGNCRCMRGADGTYVEMVNREASPEYLFERTGIQTIYGNTLFQIYERVHCQDPAIREAKHLLMLPDLLAYFLTGEKHHEYTMATTSMMYHPLQRDWDRELLRKLKLPDHIFSDILMPAQTSFPLLPQILKECDARELRYVPVGTHDTASAVAAVPLRQREAFCSSGTWSLLGVETKQPVLTREVYEANFSNEGTVDGGIRLLKNIMGMWIVQQFMKEWEQEGQALSWDEVVGQASRIEAFRSFIAVEDPVFYQAGHMIQRVQEYCRKTNQPVPVSVGELSRCVYESLAMQYRKTFETLEHILGYRLEALRIVGGGCRNKMLNQFAANALKRPVYAGPVECACVGNILVQAMENGEIGSFGQLREAAADSFPVETYEPADMDLWDEGYEKYKAVMRAGAACMDYSD